MKKRTLKNVAPAQAAVAEYKPEPKFTFRVTVHEQHYLRVGDVFDFAGRDHVVTSINECCARIVPVTEGTLVKTVFKPRFSESTVEFVKPEQNRALSISANSEVKILHRLGRAWRERIAGVYPEGIRPIVGVSSPKPNDDERPCSRRKAQRETKVKSVTGITTPPLKRGRGRPRKCQIF